MNAESGSNDKADARAAISRAVEESGRKLEIVVARRPRDLPGLARRAAERGPCILAAAGGDGTLNAVAEVAREKNLPLGIIPLGTFNYFARDLGIPEDPAGAARVLTEGQPRRVAAGFANGRIFLNNASFGLYRRLIEERETHKRRFGRRRLVALFSALATLLQRHRVYHLHLEVNGEPVAFSTLSVFFGRNALQLEQLGLDEALCVARGELAVLAPREVGRLRMLGLMLQGALGQLETAADLRQGCARRVEIKRLGGGGQRIKVAIDGEVAECRLPLVVESIPEALWMMVPTAPERER
ncbi:MAG: diacylglycerol kinase [Zoogloeaceae bacterium]|nr:diacylglycerol kinase [Zoogloeaceae bacterium]